MTARQKTLDGIWEVLFTYRLFRDERVSLERRLWHEAKATYRDDWALGTPDTGATGPFGALIGTIARDFIDPLMPALGALTSAAVRLPPPAPKSMSIAHLRFAVRGSEITAVSGRLEAFDDERGPIFGMDWRGEAPEDADAHQVSTDRALLSLTDTLYLEMPPFIRDLTAGLPTTVEIVR